MKPFVAIFSFLLLSLSSLAIAVPLVDVEITASRWQPEYSGEAGQGTDVATLEDLGFGDEEDHNVITLIFKHPVPVVPNFRVQRTGMDTSANGTLTSSFTVDGTTFTASEDVATNLDFSHTDFTLFYSPLNNWVQLDIGLTARKFDGDVSVVGSTDSASAELDGAIPLLYAAARFELPLTGWYVGGSLNTFSYDDNSLTDFSAAIGYVTDGFGVDLIAELGVRNFSLEIEDESEDIQGNIDVDGVYFSLGLKF